MSVDEFGGYFGLELPSYSDPFPNTIKFQSGRAALRAALEASGISKVFLPVYICDSVMQAVSDSGASYETYFLDKNLFPSEINPDLPDNSVFLYVNYFGLCQNNIDCLMKTLPKKQLIIDNSQALFSNQENILASVYSIRKFIGVPDGGLLSTSDLDIQNPETEDIGSLSRMKHLLQRMAYTASQGYDDYLSAEESLFDTTPLMISRLTNRILSSVDMAMIKMKRRENFLILASLFGSINMTMWKLGADEVPLCYPLVLDFETASIKRKLAKKGIYVPTYWPEVEKNIEKGTFEYQLTCCSLAIPCDQRYSSDDILRFSDEIVACLKQEGVSI